MASIDIGTRTCHYGMTIEGLIICYFHQMCPFKVEWYIGPYLVLPFMMTDILFQVIPPSNKIDLLQKNFHRLQRGIMKYFKNPTDAVSIFLLVSKTL